MNETQKRLLELSRTRDLSTMSLGEIARSVGAKYPQNAKHHLLQLEKKGLLVYPFRERERASDSIKTVNVPLVGSANCGPASMIAEENIEAYLKVSPNLVPPASENHLFALQAVGDSMNDAHVGLVNPKPITDGDFVIVDNRVNSPNNGDIVVSIIDGAANIKLFKRISDEEVALLSVSKQDHKPIYLHSKDDYAVCGKVVQVLTAANL